ncbi:MAG: polysaccharide deacetylase family protein [Pseudonocardia sp.]
MLAATVVNLTVHGIGPAPRPLDPGEDRTWVTVAQFEQALDAVAGRPDVHLTFDDGNASDVEIALPRLRERGLVAEFFVLAGRLGDPGRLDADGVQALARGGMRIGSHGWSHRDWRRMSAAQATDELDRAPQVLAELIGAPVTAVAVPFGSYDRGVLRRLRGRGARRVYTSDGGRARGDRWLQARTSLRHDCDGAGLAELLDGRPSPAASGRRAVAMLVKRAR